MSKPDREPTEKPTHSEQEAQEEGAWMARNWIGIAAISILTLLVLAVALMQATGLLDVFAPLADTESQQWGVVAILVLVVFAIAAWGWSAIAS